MANSSIYIPEFREKKKHRRLYLIPLYVFLALYFVAIAAGWLLLASPFFKVAKIEVVGNSTGSEGEILGFLKSKIPGRGLGKSLLGFDNLLAWPEAISSSDLALLPAIKSLSIVKSYRDRILVVNVDERTAFGVWCAEDECWWFDDAGVIFKKAVSSEGSLIHTVRDSSRRTLGVNSKILPDAFITNAISIFTFLSDSGFNIQEINLRDLALREMEISTYDGPKLYVSLALPADDFVQVVNEFRSRTGFKNLKYLDFRVENKLYYK